MNLAADSLFRSHPDPMWIYDLGTMRFLAVNTAATLKYGYSRDEFFEMTIADIRPEDDQTRLDAAVARLEDGRNEAGVWRHRLKSNEIVYVDITSHPVDHEGRPARLVTARDVTRLVNAEHLAREMTMRQSSDALARQFQMMFASVPGMFLVLVPEDFTVIAVSDSYLTAMGVRRTDTVGHRVFEVLPAQPEDLEHRTIRESFGRVVALCKPDLLDVQRFLMPKASGAQGVEERFWALSVSPIAGVDGTLVHLMLRMQDVTGAFNAVGAGTFGPEGLLLKPATVDLVEHTRELKLDNLRLTHLVSILRSTQRLFNTGHWEYRLADDRLDWSKNVYSIYGVNPESFGHSLEEYIALLHPDDRYRMRKNFARFMASGDSSMTMSHRVRHPDGHIVHIQGVAERSESVSGPVLSGVVQDISESREAAQTLTRTKRLLEIAGATAKFGAWHYHHQTNILNGRPR